MWAKTVNPRRSIASTSAVIVSAYPAALRVTTI
jgi:hypothetical protein